MIQFVGDGVCCCGDIGGIGGWCFWLRIGGVIKTVLVLLVVLLVLFWSVCGGGVVVLVVVWWWCCCW